MKGPGLMGARYTSKVQANLHSSDGGGSQKQTLTFFNEARLYLVFFFFFLFLLKGQQGAETLPTR